MITEFKDFRFVSGGGSDIDYQISANNSCVSVTPSTGTVTSGQIVRVEFNFSTEQCFETNFTLRAQSKECPDAEELVFTIPIPCTSLLGVLTNTPSVLNPFVFNLSIQGGNPDYQVQWQFNTALFETVTRPTSNRLELRIKSGVTVLPSTSEIRAFIEDSKGCSRSSAYILTLCSPQIFNGSVQTSCINMTSIGTIDATSAFGGYQLQSTSCAGSIIDWGTAELEYNTNRFFVQRTGSQLTIYARGSSVTIIQDTISVRVKDSAGIYSNWATITVTIPQCTVDPEILLDTQ